MPSMRVEHQTISDDNGWEPLQIRMLTRHYCEDVEIEFLQEHPINEKDIILKWMSMSFANAYTVNNNQETWFSYRKTIKIFYPYLNKEFTIFGAFIQKYSENFNQYFHLLNNEFLNPATRKVLFEKKSFKTTHSLLNLNLSVDGFNEHLG